MSDQKSNQNEKKKGIFGLFKSMMGGENSCCNMKIVPKDSLANEFKGCCCGMPDDKPQTDSNSSKKS